MDYASATRFVFCSKTMIGRHGKYVARYILVGVANSIIYCGLLWAFLRMTGFPYPVSIGFAFIIAMCFQYLANKYFTFKKTSASMAEVFRYLCSAALNYFLSVFIVWLSLNVLNIPKLYASFLSALAAASSGYLLSSYWVYKK